MVLEKTAARLKSSSFAHRQLFSSFSAAAIQHFSATNRLHPLQKAVCP